MSWATGVVMAFVMGLPAVACAGSRTVVSLDGAWEIGEGLMNSPPASFRSRAPVPGLVDEAQPAFREVGLKSDAREAFWYRRVFRIHQAVPAVAILKVHKAAYGSAVYLNGTAMGQHLPSFTPGYFDLRPALKGDGEENELVIRVGAWRDAVPAAVPSGFDFEKSRYIPGIFDSVELILAGSPNIVNVQVAPDITNKVANIQAEIENAGPPTLSALRFTIREAKSRRIVGDLLADSLSMARGAKQRVTVSIPIRSCKLWSPEDPFLYELETSTSGDSMRTRFGMREFALDHASGRAFLNGRPYFLRGNNVTLYRFFEDASRGTLPWKEDWVRKLHRSYKDMNWNSLRYCIGFPPETWYQIADEEGILIQDEFPLWQGNKWPPELKADELIREYTEWMRERWNHPCVVIWDAQNESVTEETGKAIRAVRELDLSHRPWDNGYGEAGAPGDSFESHPYLFSNPSFKLSGLARTSPLPKGNHRPNTTGNPIIINEYDWLWLNRDGSPTTLSRKVYENLLGTNSTTIERRELCARYNAALTEFWRAHRACAGVLHFCALGYSRTNGQTCDNFIDVAKLKFEPAFERCMSDAFSPLGLMVDEWRDRFAPGENLNLSVVVINDLYKNWNGKVRLRVLRDNKPVNEWFRPCAVEALGRTNVTFSCTLPREPGNFQLEAALCLMGPRYVRSLRDVKVGDPMSSEKSLSPLKPVTGGLQAMKVY
jgi:beta-galactosidase